MLENDHIHSFSRFDRFGKGKSGEPLRSPGSTAGSWDTAATACLMTSNGIPADLLTAQTLRPSPALVMRILACDVL